VTALSPAVATQTASTNCAQRSALSLQSAAQTPPGGPPPKSSAPRSLKQMAPVGQSVFSSQGAPRDAIGPAPPTPGSVLPPAPESLGHSHADQTGGSLRQCWTPRQPFVPVQLRSSPVQDSSPELAHAAPRAPSSTHAAVLGEGTARQSSRKDKSFDRVKHCLIHDTPEAYQKMATVSGRRAELVRCREIDIVMSCREMTARSTRRGFSHLIAGVLGGPTSKIAAPAFFRVAVASSYRL